MSIYFPDSRVAVEVIPDPEGLPRAACEPDVPRIYVSEEQVHDDTLIDALSQLIHLRETNNGAQRSSGADEAQASDTEKGREPATSDGHRQGVGARAADDRTPEELLEDLLDAQDELAAALAKAAGEVIVLPACEDVEGDDCLDGIDAYEELGCYEYWLQDWLDDLCSARTLSMRRPTREVSIGSCKNLYLTM